MNKEKIYKYTLQIHTCTLYMCIHVYVMTDVKYMRKIKSGRSGAIQKDRRKRHSFILMYNIKKTYFADVEFQARDMPRHNAQQYRDRDISVDDAGQVERTDARDAGVIRAFHQRRADQCHESSRDDR